MNKQNSLIEQQLNHRTIREFTEDQIIDQCPLETYHG